MSGTCRRTGCEQDRGWCRSGRSCSAGRSRATSASAGATPRRKEVRHALEVAQAADFVDALAEGIEAPVEQEGSTSPGAAGSGWPSRGRWCGVRRSTSSTTASRHSTTRPTPGCARRWRAETAGAAVIIVAQRVSTILHADRIVVLDGGRVAGIGTHTELLETCETTGRSCSPAHRGGRRVSRQAPARPSGPPRRPGPGPGPGPHGMGMPVEKARNFGTSLRRLLGRLRPHRPALLVVVALGVVSVALSIAGAEAPRQRHPAGLRGCGLQGPPGRRHQGAGGPAPAVRWPRPAGRHAGEHAPDPRVGVDFPALGRLLLGVVLVYLLSSVFSLGLRTSCGVTQRTVYALREDVDVKLGSVCR